MRGGGPAAPAAFEGPAMRAVTGPLWPVRVRRGAEVRRRSHTLTLPSRPPLTICAEHTQQLRWVSDKLPYSVLYVVVVLC